jgi:hypothetical protein
MTQPIPEDELRIDDLSFTDLLRIALENIPGASQGRWSLHGPVDPGVTLIEQFAWQLEQRLFMAEQTTDGVGLASLRLLGAAPPAATTPARTVLCLTGEQPGNELPAGTVLFLDGDRSGRRFSLDDAVTVLPVGAVDVTGRMLAAGDRLELAHDYAGPRITRKRLSLLVDVAAAPGVAPAWSPDAASVPPAGELRWTAVGRDGSESAVVVDDSTGGLRRAGLVHLDWPEVWNALGGEPCRLRATMTQGRFTEAVRINGAYANSAVASDRVAQVADLSGQLGGLLPLPSQQLRVDGAAGQLLDGPGAVTVTWLEQDGQPYTWTSVTDWLATGPADRVFFVDRARGELVFGDGRAGRIPRPAGGPATVAYSTSAGVAGNLGPGGFWVRAGGTGTAVNRVPATGGSDAETLSSAELRAAGDRATADRTVTTADAEQLVLATPGAGFQRARSSLGLHPDFPCVPVPSALSVTVVPYAERGPDSAKWTRAPQPDAGAMSAARGRVAGSRLVGQEVFVLPPVYRQVSVAVTVSRTALAPALEDRVRDALLRHLDPLEGGADGEGWPFGGAVRPSALIGVVSAELGPESTVIDLSVALDGGTPSSCGDLAIGSRELVWLGSLDVRWVTTVPAGGGLQ